MQHTHADRYFLHKKSVQLELGFRFHQNLSGFSQLTHVSPGGSISVPTLL